MGANWRRYVQPLCPVEVEERRDVSLEGGQVQAPRGRPGMRTEVPGFILPHTPSPPNTPRFFPLLIMWL